MIIVDLQQGSPEWHEHRAKHFNASDAPAMMGCSPYKTRQQLLRELATGIKPDVDAATQRRFDDGHKYEALARPIAEEIIGEDLYPVTGTNGENLSASFDGLTMMQEIALEHKSLNDELRESIKDDSCGYLLPKHYRVQMEQQHMVSGCEKILFMASKWERDVNDDYHLVEKRHCWYFPDADLRAEIIAGWKQFAEDLANYQHVEVAAEAVGRVPDALPALRIEVTGMVTNSNLEAFKAGAELMFSKINRDLQTDQDFADAEKTVKHCKEVEENIEAAKKHALSQTASIDELYRALDSVSEQARQVRLELDKLIKARKENIRAEIQQESEIAFKAHIDTINARLGKVKLPAVKADFAGVMKGKKTVTSLRDACNTELARAKIEASQLSELIGANVTTLRDMAVGFEYLFMDAQQISQKANDDLVLLIKARIAEHKAAEEASQKAKAEAEEKAAAEAQEIAMVADSITQPIKEKTKSNKRTRPTDAQIIEAVANAFGTSEQEALDWILNMQTRRVA